MLLGPSPTKMCGLGGVSSSLLSPEAHKVQQVARGHHSRCFRPGLLPKKGWKKTEDHTRG